MSLMLNADLGEAIDSRLVGGTDEAIMPHIHQASIACGYHAGDHLMIQRTLNLAARYGVMVGAHPGYPDPQGFGRRSMACSRDELVALMHYQISALDGMSRSQNLSLAYVKPHGALYNDMMTDQQIRHAVMLSVAGFYRPIRLVLQATPDAGLHRREAEAMGVMLWFEAFADRRYAGNGLLVPRSEPGAVHDREATLAQVEQIKRHGSVTTLDGGALPVTADTLCIHGDNPESVAVIREIRALLDQ
ncbi:5-oxoprolinase subunit PxpA [Porticoccus sp.]|uniref:5-oxoprolinase subunit PxpA n=1 Tax=Porticoccus sp. TaxID=2024853 RepID=UPI003F69BF88